MAIIQLEFGNQWRNVWHSTQTSIDYELSQIKSKPYDRLDKKLDKLRKTKA